MGEVLHPEGSASAASVRPGRVWWAQPAALTSSTCVGGDRSRYGASPWWTRHRPTSPLAHTPWDPAQTWATASPGSDRVGPWLPTDACAGGAARRVRGVARHRGALHSHGTRWQARSRSPRHGGRHALHLSKHSAIRPLSHLSRVCASVSCLWHQRNLRSLPCAYLKRCEGRSGYGQGPSSSGWGPAVWAGWVRGSADDPRHRWPPQCWIRISGSQQGARGVWAPRGAGSMI